ncbi:MarR family transcriptional regulator [bacterium]|nr:MarR family transcriptional regulator [bacterium]
MQDSIDRFFAEWEQQGLDLPARSAPAVYRMIRVAKILGRRLDATCARHDLTRSQYEALAALRRVHPLPLSAQDIMDASFLTSGSVTAMINQMVRTGLVRKDLDPGDKRRLRIRLTSRGKSVIEAAVRERAADNVRLTELLAPARRETLNRVMREFLAAIESLDDREPEMES